MLKQQLTLSSESLIRIVLGVTYGALGIYILGA